MLPKVSIITINFNNKDGLDKTIQSVKSQLFKNFEFIVIDGGSTDCSTQVIVQNESSIDFWLSEKDNGVYHAMNKGIKVAKGEYLLFLNSGDFLIEKNSLEKVFSTKHNADFLCGRCAITKKGKLVHITSPPEKHTFLTYFQSGLNHQSTFIKRIMFENYGFYREDFKYNADWEFWIRTIILENCSTEKINEIICEYNLEGISATQNHSDKYKSEIAEVLSNPLLQKFIPDYESWNEERKSNEVLYWIKSKKTLYNFFLILYKLAKYYNSLKKSLIFKKVHE
jgi:glycosyltransferase involved in cell wall biosynthesis